MGTQLVKSVCAREPNQEGSSCLPSSVTETEVHLAAAPAATLGSLQDFCHRAKKTKQTFPRNLETLKDRLAKQRTAARAACEGEH